MDTYWDGDEQRTAWLNGFFVETEPGLASLRLANSLVGQPGVVLSSPNWVLEVVIQ